MSEESKHVKISLPGESVWAIVVNVEKEHYKIDNAPLFEEVRFGDIVYAPYKNGRLTFASVVDRTYVQSVVEYDFDKFEDLKTLYKELSEEYSVSAEPYVKGYTCFFVEKDQDLAAIAVKILACPAVLGMEPWYKEDVVPAIADA